MAEEFGVTSMTAPLHRVAVRTPSPHSDFASAHWGQPLDVELLLDQHAAFVGLLQRLGCDVVELPALPEFADSCFVYDPAFTVGAGAIQFRSAKPVRIGEGEHLATDLATVGVPTVGVLQGTAVADGGDMFWLDDRTLAIGRSYRTNAEAVGQIADILAPQGAGVVVYDVPHDQGPEWCLHMMSLISPVRDDLAVVYERLAPVALLQDLRARGIDWVSVPEEDWLTLGCNVLAVAPGVVVMASGNDKTAEMLAERGCEIGRAHV